MGVEEKLHMGKMVETWVRSHGVSVGWLAGRISCTRNNIYGIFGRSSLDSDLLFRLSRSLDHDFFADLSSRFREDTRNAEDAQK